MKRTLIFQLLIPVAASWLALPTSSMAVVIPPSLSPGDMYRLAFVSSGRRDALSDNINDYNIFVDILGDAVLPSDWRAIASTETIDARDNTSTNPLSDGLGVPIFLTNGTKIADDNTDLWDGTIDAFFNVDENMTAIPQTAVWTGTHPAGFGYPEHQLGAPHPLGPSLVGEYMFGYTHYSDSRWVTPEPPTNVGNGDASGPFYAVSSILTVPIPAPEPATVGLVSLGAVLVIIRGRRRRKSRLG